LGLYGGIVRSIEINEKLNKEIYIFDIVSDVVECPCCSKKGIKTATKSFGYYSSFIDIPNPITNRKRVIECHYNFWTCNKCGMTLNNHLHFFDMRFNVTKRLIDYIYLNINTKTEIDISNETGLDLDTVWELIHHYYEKDFLEAYNSKRESIWFNNNNQLLT
jgi:hypothetical protein